MASVLNIADVKPLIGKLSRNNYYQVQFGGLSAGLLGYLNSRSVSSNFIARDAGLMCYEASIPGSSLADVQSSNFHGVVENFAHTRIFTPLTLNFYCDNEYKALKFLEHWMEYVVSGNGTSGQAYGSPNYNYRLKYPNDPQDGYKCNSTTIQKFEHSFERVLTYSFIGLYPQNLSSTSVKYGPSNELTRVSCSFKYDRYVAGSVLSYDGLLGSDNNRDPTIPPPRQGLVQNIIDDIKTGSLGLLQRLVNEIPPITFD